MKPLIIFISLLVSSCSGSVAVKSHSSEPTKEQVQDTDSSTFRLYKSDLYINGKGKLAYRILDNSYPSKPEYRFLTSINTDTLNPDQEKELCEVIDTASFASMEDLYYKDKNHVYYYYQMQDGGTFFIVWPAEPNSFKVLDNSYYGKDKQFVFCRGGLLQGADSKTFRVVSQPSKEVYLWKAEDKSHEYEGSAVVSGRENL